MVYHFYNAIIIFQGDIGLHEMHPVGDYVLFNIMFDRNNYISVFGRHVYLEAMFYGRCDVSLISLCACLLYITLSCRV